MGWQRCLAIETSCDETAAAVVDDGTVVRSSVVASQAALHSPYGGVFPEVAAREHMRAVGPVVAEALAQAGAGLGDLDGIAVTRGPGLAGALLVGVNFAKGLALGSGLPMAGINHMDGHLYANWLHDEGVVRREAAGPEALPRLPALSLIVSGGHTDLVLLEPERVTVLGSTRDDAAGEAFDKAARILGLGYPGGPALEAAARGGDDRAWDLPVAQMRGALDFSFSGLKSAVARAAAEPGFSPQQVPDLAASFQRAVVTALVRGLTRALEGREVAEVHLSGGVSANGALRAAAAAAVAPLPLRVPPVELCTDNAAMIAAAAFWGRGSAVAGLDCDVDAGLTVGS